MIRRHNYNICSKCYERLKYQGTPVLCMLEIIFESFAIFQEPSAIRDSSRTSLLNYLERMGYIITTEFPDPADQDKDLVLAIPLGCHKKNNLLLFCFDQKSHD